VPSLSIRIGQRSQRFFDAQHSTFGSFRVLLTPAR